MGTWHEGTTGELWVWLLPGGCLLSTSNGRIFFSFLFSPLQLKMQIVHKFNFNRHKRPYARMTSPGRTSLKFLFGRRLPRSNRHTYASRRGRVAQSWFGGNLRMCFLCENLQKLSELYFNMPNLRDVRHCLLFGFEGNLLNDEEFILLYDLNTSKNPDFPYWQYDPLDLDKLCDDECKAEFRFLKNDIYVLKDVLQIPDEVVCYNRLVVDGIEALCVLLKRFAYPIRYSDMCPRFARPVPQFSIITTAMVDIIYRQHSHRLRSFHQAWLSPANLQTYADVIHEAGAPYTNCWGFVDGTVRPVCRPGTLQRPLYNGHKRVHAIKFQSVVAPNGLIANLHGPVEGRRHDSGMLADSGLLPQLELHSRSPLGNPLCIYGDLGYPLRPQLQTPFRGLHLTPLQQQFNTSMSTVGSSVEWVFGDNINYFSFLDFKKNLKIGLSAVGKMYIICALLTNARTCLYPTSTSSFFNLGPPSLQEYFS